VRDNKHGIVKSSISRSEPMRLLLKGRIEDNIFCNNSNTEGDLHVCTMHL